MRTIRKVKNPLISLILCTFFLVLGINLFAQSSSESEEVDPSNVKNCTWVCDKIEMYPGDDPDDITICKGYSSVPSESDSNAEKAALVDPVITKTEICEEDTSKTRTVNIHKNDLTWTLSPDPASLSNTPGEYTISLIGSIEEDTSCSASHTYTFKLTVKDIIVAKVEGKKFIEVDTSLDLTATPEDCDFEDGQPTWTSSAGGTFAPETGASVTWTPPSGFVSSSIDDVTITATAPGGYKTHKVTVVKVEIVDPQNGDAVIGDTSTGEIAIRDKWKAKVTPKDIPNLKYQWYVDEETTPEADRAIYTYEQTLYFHGPVTSLNAGHLQKEELELFWVNGNIEATVKLEVTFPDLVVDEETTLTLTPDPDPNKNIYSEPKSTANLADVDEDRQPGKFRLNQRHKNWHAKYDLDGEIFFEEYVGAKFLVDHSRMITASKAWRATFKFPPMRSREAYNPLSNNHPIAYAAFLTDNGSTKHSRVYGYVRKGEFGSMEEIGDDMQLWHFHGHNVAPDALMQGPDSISSADDILWKWHQYVDDQKHIAIDKAEVEDKLPRFGAVVPNLTEISFRFSKAVSHKNGFSQNDKKIDKKYLKLEVLDENNKLHVIALGDAVTADNLTFKFPLLSIPPKGLVSVKLTGTASYEGTDNRFVIK